MCSVEFFIGCLLRIVPQEKCGPGDGRLVDDFGLYLFFLVIEVVNLHDTSLLLQSAAIFGFMLLGLRGCGTPVSFPALVLVTLLGKHQPLVVPFVLN